MSSASMIYLALLLAGITLLVIYSRTGKLIKCIFFTAASGFCALGGLLLLSRLTVIELAVTPLTVLVSGILGIPGVVSMLIFNLI